jgi:hypothetical protein
VLRRLGLPSSTGGALAVFPGFVFGAKLTENWLKDNFGNITCALLGGAKLESGLKAESVVTQQEKEALAGRLGGFEKVVMVTPPLWLLSAIARGDDSVYPAMLALRPLLWGKEVIILLDFETPKIRRSAALLRIAEDISALEEMGARIVCLPQEIEKDEPKELVTEQDVKDAAKSESGRIIIKPGAIVTQLARDTAREMDVIVCESPR